MHNGFGSKHEKSFAFFYLFSRKQGQVALERVKTKISFLRQKCRVDRFYVLWLNLLALNHNQQASVR